MLAEDEQAEDSLRKLSNVNPPPNANIQHEEIIKLLKKCLNGITDKECLFALLTDFFERSQDSVTLSSEGCNLVRNVVKDEWPCQDALAFLHYLAESNNVDLSQMPSGLIEILGEVLKKLVTKQDENILKDECDFEGLFSSVNTFINKCLLKKQLGKWSHSLAMTSMLRDLFEHISLAGYSVAPFKKTFPVKVICRHIALEHATCTPQLTVEVLRLAMALEHPKLSVAWFNENAPDGLNALLAAFVKALCETCLSETNSLLNIWENYLKKDSVLSKVLLCAWGQEMQDACSKQLQQKIKKVETFSFSTHMTRLDPEFAIKMVEWLWKEQECQSFKERAVKALFYTNNQDVLKFILGCHEWALRELFAHCVALTLTGTMPVKSFLTLFKTEHSLDEWLSMVTSLLTPAVIERCGPKQIGTVPDRILQELTQDVYVPFQALHADLSYLVHVSRRASLSREIFLNGLANVIDSPATSSLLNNLTKGDLVTLVIFGLKSKQSLQVLQEAVCQRDRSLSEDVSLCALGYGIAKDNNVMTLLAGRGGGEDFQIYQAILAYNETTQDGNVSPPSSKKLSTKDKQPSNKSDHQIAKLRAVSERVSKRPWAKDFPSICLLGFISEMLGNVLSTMPLGTLCKIQGILAWCLEATLRASHFISQPFLDQPGEREEGLLHFGLTWSKVLKELLETTGGDVPELIIKTAQVCLKIKTKHLCDRFPSCLPELHSFLTKRANNTKNAQDLLTAILPLIDVCSLDDFNRYLIPIIVRFNECHRRVRKKKTKDETITKECIRILTNLNSIIAWMNVLNVAKDAKIALAAIKWIKAKECDDNIPFALVELITNMIADQEDAVDQEILGLLSALANLLSRHLEDDKLKALCKSKVIPMLRAHLEHAIALDQEEADDLKNTVKKKHSQDGFNELKNEDDFNVRSDAMAEHFAEKNEKRLTRLAIRQQEVSEKRATRIQKALLSLTIAINEGKSNK